jgi:hypothetical protein
LYLRNMNAEKLYVLDKYTICRMSAFAGKQTFRALNSNVCFILKADGQT